MIFDRSKVTLALILSLGGAGQTVCAIVVATDFDLSDSANFVQSQPNFSSVGWVEIQEGTARFRGTGVLLNSSWVLTAAHNWLTAEVTGLTFHIGGAAHPAVFGGWHQHPGWLQSPQVGLNQGWDVGLFRLESPVSGAPEVRLYSGGAELGTEIVFAGFGLAGTSDTGPRANSTPTLYGATNTIDRVVSFSGDFGAGGLLATDFDSGAASVNTLVGTSIYDTSGSAASLPPGAALEAQSSGASLSRLEGTTAAGDSGGPAFADFGDGPELVGLVSWGVNPAEPTNPYGSGDGDVAYFTRIASARDWITAVVPEPSAYVLVFSILVGGLVVFRHTPFRTSRPS